MRRALAFLLLLSTSALADEGRYQDYAVGARALGLGGAFTALADDGSGVFYNPAGIVDTGRAKLSISTSLYGLELAGETPIEGATSRLESGVSAADLIIIPSATGYVAGLGRPLPNGSFRHAWAFGTQVPQFQSRFIEAEETAEDGTVTRLRSATLDRTLHAGLAYAVRVGPWLRLGASAHYVLRTLNSEEDFTSLGPDDDEFLSSEAQLRTSIHSLRLSGGVKLWPGPRWRIGVSVLSPTMSVYRDGNFRALSIDGRSGGEAVVEEIDVPLKGLDFASVLPLTVRAGAAFLERGDFALSGDVVYYGAGAYDLVPLSEVNGGDKVPIPLEIRREPIVNVAFGGEKYLADNISVSAGLFTNFSAAPPIAVDPATGLLLPGSSRLSNVHMIGGSLTLGLHTENVSSRLGVTGSLGYGRGVRPSDARFGDSGAPPLSAVEESQAFIYVFWSSSFRHGEGGGQRRFDL